MLIRAGGFCNTMISGKMKTGSHLGTIAGKTGGGGTNVRDTKITATGKI